MGTKDTENVDEKPDGKAKKEEPRECLLLSCSARSSSIAVRQTTVESVQPDGEISNFADICESMRKVTFRSFDLILKNALAPRASQNLTC